MAIYASDANSDGPRLQPSRSRILESVLFLIEEAERRGIALTQYDIAKSVFLADTDHLNRFGRPVTFDNFVAMQYGPVPSETYDMLKADYDWSGKLGMVSAPWTRRSAGGKAFQYLKPKRSANLRVLSKTDVEALGEALTLVKSLGFGGVKDHTHKHPAYVAAWKPERGAVFDMDYRKLLDQDDPALLGDLVHASRHLR